ncbi:phosphoglycerate kinase [Azospirillum picis]|uniref:Phosphoglycerate kinase n=2 Tax=Azospirillum picis TaxID=488438 RepID=A0ABU0MQE7_9PROT|nr:phosphoglycerate kinase [Azospirillum picis]MBP2302004.1 phosphoglycerate kinase [Azospirillum picis]MDQ0535705.1 phosphoglycerate kinase [Azospirillum picis]
MTPPVYAPALAIVGGLASAAKLDLLDRLAGEVDALALGGAVANGFLAATGTDMGASLYGQAADQAFTRDARAILDKAKAHGCTVLLPVDLVVATEVREGAEDRAVPCSALGPEDMALDIGPATVARLTACVEAVRTVLWTGPLGACEIAPFDAGTNALAWFIARRTRDAGLLSVAAGAATLAALAATGVEERFSALAKPADLPDWLGRDARRMVPA